jgi:hypothetical protein
MCVMMSDAKKEESFTFNRCGRSFDSENQMNAHKVSVHSTGGGELTTR